MGEGLAHLKYMKETDVTGWKWMRRRAIQVERASDNKITKTELLITFNTSVLDGPNLFFLQNMTLTSASLVNSKPLILHWLWFLGFSISLTPNYYHSSSHVFPSSKNRPLKLSHFLIFTAITLVLVSVTSCLKYSINLLAVLLASLLISFPIHSSTCGQRDHSKRLFRSYDSKPLNGFSFLE